MLLSGIFRTMALLGMTSSSNGSGAVPDGFRVNTLIKSSFFIFLSLYVNPRRRR
jgi:hypothetical protein